MTISVDRSDHIDIQYETTPVHVNGQFGIYRCTTSVHGLDIMGYHFGTSTSVHCRAYTTAVFCVCTSISLYISGHDHFSYTRKLNTDI